MANRVVARKHLPVPTPLIFTLTVHLLLREYQPPGWVYGFAWTILALLWIAFIIGRLTLEEDCEPVWRQTDD